MPSLPERVQADLKAAMRARDQPAVRALRSALAAFANAEAPPIEVGGAAGAIEAAASTSEHERLVLTEDDHRRLLEAEVAQRRAAVAEYGSIGRPAAAADVAAELAALEAHLD